MLATTIKNATYLFFWNDALHRIINDSLSVITLTIQLKTSNNYDQLIAPTVYFEA